MDHTYEQDTNIGSIPMGLPSASTLTGMNADQPSVGGTPLAGRWLILARMLWCATFVLSLALLLASILVNRLDLVTTMLLVAATSVWFAVSGVLFWRKSTDRVILLFSLAFMLVGGIFLPPFPGALYGGIPWGWELLLDVIESLAQAACLVFYLFPDGQFVPRWTRWLALAWIVLSFDQNIPTFINVGAFNPWNSPFSLSIYRLVEVAFIGSLVFSLLYRYRRVSTPVQRQQTKWVVFAFTIGFVGTSAAALELSVLPYYFPALGLPGQLAQLVSSTYSWGLPVLIPLSMGIALLRYRLWDIDLIINRTLVYGVLTLSIVAFYVLVVVGLGMLFQAHGNLGIALLATGLVAVLFQPWRTRLQRAVNRLMYGDRDDPYRVISRLGSRLEATLAPDAVLPTIVETVAQALRLPYAAMTLKQDGEFVMVATYGTLRSEVIRLPLVYQTEQVGELVLAPRAPGERFTPADRALLEDLARQAGIAVHAVRLTADLTRLTVDLQRSRERLVTAREEERRRCVATYMTDWVPSSPASRSNWRRCATGWRTIRWPIRCSLTSPKGRRPRLPIFAAWCMRCDRQLLTSWACSLRCANWPCNTVSRYPSTSTYQTACRSFLPRSRWPSTVSPRRH